MLGQGTGRWSARAAAFPTLGQAVPPQRRVTHLWDRMSPILTHAPGRCTDCCAAPAASARGGGVRVPSISGDRRGLTPPQLLLFFCWGMVMLCPVLSPPPQAPPWVVGCSLDSIWRAKRGFLNSGSPFLTAEGCSAGSLHPGKGEAFWEHQWDHSCGSNPEPSSVLNIFPKALKPPRGY